jgi:hypothetical protein
MFRVYYKDFYFDIGAGDTRLFLEFVEVFGVWHIFLLIKVGSS